MRKLIEPALAELGLPFELVGDSRAIVKDGDLEFEIVARVERQFLMRFEIAEFRVPMALRGGSGNIRLRHGSKRSPTRVVATAKPASSELEHLAERLAGDTELNELFGQLDAKRTVVEVGPDSSTATIRNVGLSRVVMAFPPTRRYITAGPEQVKILRATMRCLAGMSE